MTEELDHRHHQVLEDLSAPAKELRSYIPDVYKGFAEMSKGAMAEGVLSAAVKEALAIAISVANQCDGCIASHARSAARKGTTNEQVAEAIGVAILLTGGPGTVYGPRAYEAFVEFKAEYDAKRPQVPSSAASPVQP